MAEQIAVVAADLDHKGSLVQSSIERNTPRQSPSMVHEGIGHRGEVGVLDEELFGGDGLTKLNEAT